MAMLQTGQKKCLRLKKVKTCVVDMKKETNQKEFRIEKVIKKKNNKLDVKWKD